MNASRRKKAVSAASAQSRVQPKIRTQRQPREQRLLHGLYWLLATAIFCADQLSKIAAQGHLSEGPIEILPILNFSLAYNRGAAFGVFSDSQMAASLLAVSIVATIAFAIFLHRESRTLPCLGWSLLLGGALGNGLDRMLFNRVTDFIDFHLFGHHFPAFNIADTSLTFGVLLMVLAWLSDKKPAADNPPPSSSRRKKRALTEAEADGAHSATPAVEASENRQAAGELASTAAPAPFAPLAEANLSQAFAAKPYSAGWQRQEET